MKLIQNLFLVLGLLSACTSLAEAHAYLDHAEPKVGSTVKASPSVVKIWFTMEVQGPLTTIEVFDATGREVDKKDAKLDPNNKALMAVSVPKLAAGTYKGRVARGLSMGAPHDGRLHL